MVGDNGAMRFTRPGRARYAGLFARYGCALENVKTIQRFVELMSHINYCELKANTGQLKRILNDPATSEAERDVIRRALGMDYSD